MASEDPTSMFADMKKKKKKPKVAFSEDPVNADADPTYPPKEPIDDPSLGPTTVHERIQNNENATGNAEDGAEGANMFADLKKKKKKRDLAADVVRIGPSMKDVIVDGSCSLQETDATLADGGADALDFSDLKKKKKKKEVVESVSYISISLLRYAIIDVLSFQGRCSCTHRRYDTTR
jgi:translation initiation factor 2 subunit 2